MANPVLNDRRFAQAKTEVASSTTELTRAGVMSALGTMLVLLLASACLSWWHFSRLMSLGTTRTQIPSNVNSQFLVLLLVSLGAGLAAVLVPKAAAILGPLYAVVEGALVGAVSFIYNATYPGIVIEAVGATLAVAVVMYVLYASHILKVTNRMRSTIISATLGVVIFYFIAWLIAMCGGINLFTTGGPLGIGVSLLISGIAAFNLLLDFDFIDRLVATGAPKRMEWYAATGVVITLVWLYLEMLRLLSRFRR
jgi:uncharacterized YccA/Bax inhibitor family protein